MAFSEVREYIPGDDIRSIDWNVTARFNHPYVKIFEEERELTVMLLIDVSASGLFGTNQQLKKELMTELAAVLAFSAMKNNDKVGAMLFSDRIERFIPPRKGKSHVLRILSEIVSLQPAGKKTDLNKAIRYYTDAIKKRSVTFLLSDFISDTNYESAIRIASGKHDLVALEVTDEREKELPDLGLVPMMDPETGESIWVNTSYPKVRNHYKAKFLEREDYLKKLFNRLNVDHARMLTGHSYIQPLLALFKRRER
jgi:uncharacterized protein (DUF58 family)